MTLNQEFSESDKIWLEFVHNYWALIALGMCDIKICVRCRDKTLSNTKNPKLPEFLLHKQNHRDLMAGANIT